MAQEESSYKLYENNDLGVFMKYPDSWEFIHNPRTVFILSKRSEGVNKTFKENINLVVNSSSGKNTTEYIENCKKMLSSYLVNYKEVSTNYIKDSHKSYVKLIYEYEIDSISLKVILYVIIKNGKAYNLTCSATARSFTSYSRIFEEMINSFEVK